MAIKHIDTYRKNWSVAYAGVLSFGYCIFVLPFHIPVAIYSILNLPDFMNSRFVSDKLIALSCLIIPTAIFMVIYSIKKQRHNIQAFTSTFKELGFFNAQPHNIMMNRSGLGYLGLDTKKGILLYINHPETTVLNFFFPKDVRVMGFGMYDWKSVEVEGNTLRIYTGIPELPRIAIAHGNAAQMYEKINAMRHQNWTYENNIPGYVEYQATRIAEANNLNLVLPPK